MPFGRPSLRDIIARIVDDIAARLPGAAAGLRRSVLGVLARVFAGAIDGVYGYLTWLARQLFPDTAEGVFLNRWAAIWGVSRRPAARAFGQIRVTGFAGSMIPAGTVWASQRGRSSDGAAQTPIMLASTADVTIAANGVALVPAQAVDAGAAGNLPAGSRPALVAALSGIMSDGRIDVAWGGGADVEEDESLRERLMFRIQEPPEGGSYRDYLRWALDVPGVTRAWVYPHRLGLGTVGIMVMWQDGAGGDRRPTDSELQIVFNHIDDMKPMTAGPFVFAPLVQAIDLTIRLKPPDEAVKKAVIANLVALFRREGAPGGELLISHIREAISTALGEWDHVVEPVLALGITLDGYGNIRMADAAGVPALGVVTWLSL